jgi:hypothetical protein
MLYFGKTRGRHIGADTSSQANICYKIPNDGCDVCFHKRHPQFETIRIKAQAAFAMPGQFISLTQVRWC